MIGEFITAAVMLFWCGCIVGRGLAGKIPSPARTLTDEEIKRMREAVESQRRHQEFMDQHDQRRREEKFWREYHRQGP